MKLSILISTFNHFSFIDECIESALCLNEVEIICTDDFSADDSAKRLMFYSDSYENVKYIAGPKKNLGLSGRIRLISEGVTGDYVLILNSDDTLNPEGTISALRRAYNYDTDFVFGALGLIETNGSSEGLLDGPFEPQIPYSDEIKNLLIANLRNFVASRKFLFESLLVQNWVRSSSNIIMKSNVFREIGFLPDFYYASDWALALDLSRHYCGCYTSVPFVNYRTHDSNTITRDIRQSQVEVQAIFDLLLSNNPSLTFDHSVLARLSENIYLK